MSTSVPTLPDTEFHRGFIARIRETVAPEHGRIAAVLDRAADSIREHGATPELAETMRQVTRGVAESGDVAGAGVRLLNAVDTATCTVLAGQCVEHEIDCDDFIHSGQEVTLDVGEHTDLLPFVLRKWGDGQPYIAYGLDCRELDVAGADAVIDAELRHVAALIDARNHLAAALGGGAVASQADMVDAVERLAMDAVSASLAGLRTNPRDVAQRLHRAVDNAQGWHLAGVGDHSEAAAYADARFSTAVDAMADAISASAVPARMADSLRSALDMVIGEAR
jgi:hypothetical protein